MKNSIPILNKLLEINLDSSLKDTNYKELYIQCKKNVKEFIAIVQKQIQTILQCHRQEKQSLINQIKLLKGFQKQKPSQRTSQSNYHQSSSKIRSHSSNSFRNLGDQESFLKINEKIKQNTNGINSRVSLQIDNILQKTMNRSLHMKQLQKLFVGQSKISKIQSIKPFRQALRQKKNNIQSVQFCDRKKVNIIQSKKEKLSDNNSFNLAKQNKNTNASKFGSVNNILSNMRQIMNQKIQNQSSLAYKSIDKNSQSLIQSPYFGKVK